MPGTDLMRSFFRVVLLVVGLGAATGSAGLQEVQQTHINRLCGEPQYAYEHGYNAALKRQPMNTAWVDQYCLPESRPSARQSWINGYQTAARNAPIVVVSAAPAPAPVAQCRFASDCGGDGYSCRQWQGSQVCMGFGRVGAPCWFGSDCLSDRCDGNSKTCH